MFHLKQKNNVSMNFDGHFLKCYFYFTLNARKKQLEMSKTNLVSEENPLK